ncbi:MAG: FtsX-like permease family protein [Gammaproteobacteria bacterium]
MRLRSSFWWVQKALLSHYWRHPWQTLFLVVGLVSGVGLWSAVQIINGHARASYEQADSLLGAQANYWIRSKSEQGISQAKYIALRRAGFRQIFPIIEAELSTPQGDPINIIATDLFALPADLVDRGDIDVGTDSAFDWLEFIQPPYRAWVPDQLADELGLKKGDTLQLRDGRILPPALIQSRSQQGRQVLMDIGAAFALLDNRRLSYLAVGKISPAQLIKLASMLSGDLELVENQQYLDLSQLTKSLHTHLTAMSLLSFAVGLFIVFNAVRFSLWYRRDTFLNLRLMGVGVPVLAAAILLETLLWSFIGTVLGLLVGMQLGQLLLPGLSASLHSLYNATVAGTIELQFDTLFKAWLITLFGLSWALTWPLYRQLKNDVLPASSTGAVQDSERATRRNLALGALLLALAAAILYPRLDSANSGFLLLGLLLFAAAWILPTLLALSLGLIARFTSERSLLGRWLISDGWSQLPAFRTAMMALLLAMTANLGVGTLVDSFRGAFIGWLEIRQSADIYVRGSQIDRQLLLDSETSKDWLADSHVRIGVTTRWQDRPTLVRGADTRAPDSLNFPLAQWLGDSPADALELWRTQADAVLANEQVHYLGGLKLGETVQLETDEGLRAYRVVGFFYDYGNPYYQFYLPFDEVRKRWKYAYSRGIALWLKPGSGAAKDPLQLAEEKLREAGVRPGDWILQADIRKLSVNIFNRTFAITSAMNALTMIVAAIALLASLLAILQERLPQFAQWRALGVRQGEQLLLIACPLLIFVGIAWLLAIPLGALLSWILINKLNIVSFGWSMPMQWEMAPAWYLGLLVLAVVAFTLMLAMLQLRRRLPEALAQLGESI